MKFKEQMDIREFNQSNRSEIIRILQKEARKSANCIGIATYGFATKGAAWLVFAVILLCFPLYCFSAEPNIRYIYPNSHYRNVTPSYNHRYIPYFSNKNSYYGQNRQTLFPSYPTRPFNSTNRMGYKIY